MQIYSDRFETTLPKEERFQVRPKSKKPQKPEFVAFLGYLSTGVLLGLTVMGIMSSFKPRTPAASPAPYPGAILVNPTPAPPLPDPVPVRRALPIPATASAPRAKLLHIRPIGTYENDTMPDGRILTTRYMGELSGAGSLPTYGANLGDMWYTMNDGHCWVLAPVTAGSSTVGWVDP
jgi:hypothetical protein